MAHRVHRAPLLATMLLLSLGAAASEQKPAKDAAPEQFIVTVIQGANEAEAQRLLSGRASSTISTQTGRSQRRSASLRVSADVPARIERGSQADVLDSVYFGLWRGGGGASLRTVDDTYGYDVTVRRRGKQLEVELAPWSSRRARDLQTERDVQSLSTMLVVEPGAWVRVGGGDAPTDAKSKRYGAGTRDVDGSVLVRVAPIP